MGEVIRKDAAIDDIITDARTTLTRALARGGDWQTAAEGRLGSVLTLCDAVRARLADGRVALAPLVAGLETENERADKLLARVSDDIWNLVGRPGNDAALDLLFPGGFAYYADGPIDEQPDKMNLLASLLESKIHPRLDDTKARAFATEIRGAATELRAKVDATRPARAAVQLAERMETAVGRAAQVALASLKRAWKADGKSDAEIHEVIPDRPKPTKKAAPVAS